MNIIKILLSILLVAGLVGCKTCNNHAQEQEWPTFEIGDVVKFKNTDIRATIASKNLCSLSAVKRCYDIRIHPLMNIEEMVWSYELELNEPVINIISGPNG